MDMNRPLSYSAISTFKDTTWGGPEAWYRKYVLHQKQPTSREMEFGSYVDTKLQTDPLFLPHVERYPISQHKMEVFFAGIPLLGLADGFDREGKRLKDDKTGKATWTQKRADDSEQLTMYTLLLYVTEKIPPEDLSLFISWLPTKDNGDFTISFKDDPPIPQIFETKRTMLQVLLYGKEIKRVWKAMQEYAANHE